MNVYHVRRDNLRELIRQHGGPAALAKKLGYTNGSFLSQVAGKHPSKDLSEKAARKIEAELGLAPYFLDEDSCGELHPEPIGSPLYTKSTAEPDSSKSQDNNQKDDNNHKDYGDSVASIEKPTPTEYDNLSTVEAVYLASRVMNILRESIVKREVELRPEAIMEIFKSMYTIACRIKKADEDIIDGTIDMIAKMQNTLEKA